MRRQRAPDRRMQGSGCALDAPAPAVKWPQSSQGPDSWWWRWGAIQVSRPLQGPRGVGQPHVEAQEGGQVWRPGMACCRRLGPPPAPRATHSAPPSP